MNIRDQYLIWQIMQRNRFKLLYFIAANLIISLPFSQVAHAWDGHILFTYLALKNTSHVGQNDSIPTETFQAFLNSEQQGLVGTLNEIEIWAQKSVPLYPSLPQSLVFTAKAPTPITTRFAHALRINPGLNFPIYVALVPKQIHPNHGMAIDKSKVMLPDLASTGWIHLPSPPLQELKPGELLSPLEIIATASDEPDYGMDDNLWDDSPHGVGGLYQWGEQPFGNKNFELGSQAPFHMGFYYESSIVYKLSSVQRCYPEYRIYQFMSLARFAFQTGHPYWGYRFLGWSLHYVQDLTQPYHATLAPGIRFGRLILVAGLSAIAIQGPELRLIQLVSNRHFSLENYTYFLLEDSVLSNVMNFGEEAIQDKNHDASYPPYDQNYPRTVIAKESHALAESVNDRIKYGMPERYVLKSDYIFYITEPIPPDLYQKVKNEKNPSIAKLNEDLKLLLQAVGSHTRIYINYVLSSVVLGSAK